MPHVPCVKESEQNRDMVSCRLARQGNGIPFVENGKEGLQRMDETFSAMKQPDISMPEADGWRILPRSYRSPKMKPILLIALAAHDLLADRTRPLRAGLDDYAIKPLGMSRSLKKMKALLNSGVAA